MKHKLFLIATVLLSCSFILPLNIMMKSMSPEPFAYSFGALDPMTGKVKAKLENVTAVYQKPKGKTTTSSVYNITGAKSPVRLKIADAVFEVYSDQSTGTLNPSLYISLYKLSTGKTNRTLTINNSGSGDAMLMPVSFTQLDQLVNRIAVTVAILPGEYAFIDKTTTTSDGNVTVWTFGID